MKEKRKRVWIKTKKRELIEEMGLGEKDAEKRENRREQLKERGWGGKFFE